MPPVAVAFCPHPPILIPEIASGAAPELAALRTACDSAVETLLAGEPEVVVAVGAGTRTGWLPSDSYASFAPFGVSIEFPLRAGVPSVGGMPEATSGRGSEVARGARLPLSLAVAAWLLARRAPGAPVEVVSVAGDTSLAGAAARAAVATRLHQRPDRLALLVMGDGSAHQGTRSAGNDDPCALVYDDRIARALADADPAALAALDPDGSAEWQVAGWAPWQVLAATVRDRGWRGRLSYYAAPYGVAYFVANWTPS